MKETINTAGGAQQNQPLVGRVTSAQQKRHVVLMATKETSGFSSGRNPKLLAVVSSYVASTFLLVRRGLRGHVTVR